MKQPLTEKQKDTLKFIEQHIQKHGIAPSFREIGKRFRLSALSSTWHRVNQLEEKGWIKRKKGHARYIEVV